MKKLIKGCTTVGLLLVCVAGVSVAQEENTKNNSEELCPLELKGFYVTPEERKIFEKKGYDLVPSAYLNLELNARVRGVEDLECSYVLRFHFEPNYWMYLRMLGLDHTQSEVPYGVKQSEIDEAARTYYEREVAEAAVIRWRGEKDGDGRIRVGAVVECPEWYELDDWESIYESRITRYVAPANQVEACQRWREDLVPKLVDRQWRRHSTTYTRGW